MKARNYSFLESRRLPYDKMTEVSGIKIPAIPGSSYHAIIASLAENKDKFTSWTKIIYLTKKNMRKYGGENSWSQFELKKNVKPPDQRIKDNAHTLTRSGRDCYGRRLHEMGCTIYFFKDGAMLVTGGSFLPKNDGYEVVFPDGRGLQKRYRGTTMTYKEYKKFLDNEFIDSSGTVIDHDAIRRSRSNGVFTSEIPEFFEEESIQVCVTLNSSFGQSTAYRLEQLGLVVEQASGNELIGSVHPASFENIKNDRDVKTIDFSSRSQTEKEPLGSSGN